jgi:hypothetical protein
MPDPLQSRALQRAAEILGGIDELRACLQVSLLHLEAWMQGRARLPDAVFLKVVDILARDKD